VTALSRTPGGTSSVWTDAGGSDGADLVSANGRGFVRNAKTEQANDQPLFSAVGSEWQAEGIWPGGQFNQLGKGCGP
jgi:hypothetical protein